MTAPERQEIARLDGIDDWGVTLWHGDDHPLQEPDRDAVVFIPWHHIFAVWLAGKSDIEGPPGSVTR